MLAAVILNYFWLGFFLLKIYKRRQFQNENT